MHALNPLTSYDALLDSPHFRQLLYDHEKALQLAAVEMQKFEAQFRQVLSIARKLSDAQLSLSSALRVFEVRSSESDCMTNIGTSLLKIGRIMEEGEQRRKESIDQAVKLYLKPLDDFREGIKHILSIEKTRFKRSSKRLYAAQARNLSTDTTKVANIEDFDPILSTEARKYHAAALRYVWQLQCVGERIKFEFIDSIGAFLHALFTSYLNDDALFAKIKPFLDTINANIHVAKTRLSLTEGNAARFKTAYLTGMEKPGEHSRAKNDKIKEAYVYVPTSVLKNIGLKLLPTAWIRHYAVYSMETRVLTLVPVNTENLQSMREVLKQSNSFKVTSAQSTTATNRRFCIDVTSENENTAVIQAVTKEDCRDWLACMNQ